MNALRAILKALRDWLVYSVPADVSDDMPNTLDEYRKRKEINEQAKQNGGGNRGTL